MESTLQSVNHYIQPLEFHVQDTLKGGGLIWDFMLSNIYMHKKQVTS